MEVRVMRERERGERDSERRWFDTIQRMNLVDLSCLCVCVQARVRVRVCVRAIMCVCVCLRERGGKTSVCIFCVNVSSACRVIS